MQLIALSMALLIALNTRLLIWQAIGRQASNAEGMVKMALDELRLQCPSSRGQLSDYPECLSL